jgi:phosphate starvation-inducible protein PhoH and related proteins
MPRKRHTSAEPAPKPLIYYFKPRTENQEFALETILNNDLTFLLGPAGTGKTYLAVYAALREMMLHNDGKRKQVQKIIITRPIVEAGEKLGALPGEIKDKVDPYMKPIYNSVRKLVNDDEKFIEENMEITPLAYMRGDTFEHSVAILDEAQNCTEKQLTLFMTRLGTGGKMIISGDTDQTDIGRLSGLADWVDILQGAPNIGFVTFTEDDIVRHPLVKTILMRRAAMLKKLNAGR